MSFVKVIVIAPILLALGDCAPSPFVGSKSELVTTDQRATADINRSASILGNRHVATHATELIDFGDELELVQGRVETVGNWQQQVTDSVGVFARASWADGNVEPWDFTDIDRTVSGGVSLNGKPWGRPDDTIGIAGVVNGISKVHQEFFNDWGFGHSHWGRHAAASRARTNHRDLLQLCAHRLDAADRRLPVHQQSRLQHRPRASECFFRAGSLAVLGEN
jgi:hypothetical protein